jgi:hypothetical protein
VEGGEFWVRREGEGTHITGIYLDGVERDIPVIWHSQLAAGSELVVRVE